MSNNQYRLQALLDIRERTKKDKEEALAEVKKKLQMEQQKAEDLRKQHQEMKDNRNRKQDEITQQMQEGNLGINDFLNSERYIKRLDKGIEDFLDVIKEQDKVVVFAEQEVEWAFEEMLQANQEFKALEKHKENWDEERKKEIAQKQALQQEEIATTLYLFKDQ